MDFLLSLLICLCHFVFSTEKRTVKLTASSSSILSPFHVMITSSFSHSLCRFYNFHIIAKVAIDLRTAMLRLRQKCRREGTSVVRQFHTRKITSGGFSGLRTANLHSSYLLSFLHQLLWGSFLEEGLFLALNEEVTGSKNQAF